MVIDQKVEGKYKVLFEKGIKGAPDFGTLEDIRVGDVILLYQGAYKYYTIGLVGGSKWNRKLKTKPVMYDGAQLTKAFFVEYPEIMKLMRLIDQPPEPNKQVMLPI